MGRPWRSGECDRPITRGLVVHSLHKKRIGGLIAGGVSIHILVIQLNACFFHTFVCVFLSYICMRFCHTFVCLFLFIHFYAGFCHTFVCGFLSYICMRFCMRFCHMPVFFHTFVCVFVYGFFSKYFYVCIWVGRGAVVSVVVQ